MKRIWFAVLFLAIAAAVCVFEQQYISNFCSEMNRECDKAISCIERDDNAGFQQSADKVQKIWDDKNDFLFALSGHTLPDELSFKANTVPYSSESIYEIKAIIKAIYESSRIKPSNIL